MPVERKETMLIPGGGEMPGAAVECQIRHVKSGNVEWIGWPLSGEPCLIVQFRGGGRYAYLGVSRQQAVAAANASSTGIYINSRIKPFFEVAKLR